MLAWFVTLAILFTTDSSMLISVCIASYCRPEGLKRLLLALMRQSLPDNVGIHIIVVDKQDRRLFFEEKYKSKKKTSDSY